MNTTAALFLAICLVESGGNPRAYNAAENAAGIAQIRPICVADCNRIAELRGLAVRFSLADRYDVQKSYQMFVLYTDHYSDGTAEQRARIWNGGPHGDKKPQTLPYWCKVERRLRQINARLAVRAAHVRPNASVHKQARPR